MGINHRFLFLKKGGGYISGKTHVNLGFLASAIATPLPMGPALGVMLAFNMMPAYTRYFILAFYVGIVYFYPAKGGVLLLPLAVIVGSLFPDLDQPNSTLSRMIAPTDIIIKTSLALVGGLIIWIGFQDQTTWLMAIGIATAILGTNIISNHLLEKTQRILLILAGGALIYWSPNSLLISLGVLYIIMGVLSHRGLTHSPEGAALAIVGCWLLTTHIGKPELLLPFAIGYITHILADLFADHGVYATYAGKIKVSIPLVKTHSLLERGLGVIVMVLVVVFQIGHLDVFSLLH